MSNLPFAPVNVPSGSTDYLAIPAISGKRIWVTAVAVLVGSSQTNVTFNSKGSGAGTAISCLFACAANGGIVLPKNGDGWFQTNIGEALTVTTSSGSTAGIQLLWIAV